MINKSTGKKIQWAKVKTKLNPLGYYCPILTFCCYCIPLKVATFVIAGLGLIPTSVCIFLATLPGRDFLQKNGLPVADGLAIGYIYAGLGVTVFSLHVILFIAALLGRMKLFAVYLWGMIFYIIVSLVLGFVISIITFLSGHLLFASVYLLLSLLYTGLLIYFWIVIQSKLYNVKDESNVVNIHITII